MFWWFSGREVVEVRPATTIVLLGARS